MILPKLLWIKKKYSKDSLCSELYKNRVVCFREGLVVLCSNSEKPEGVYKGNGIIQSYGKCKIERG